MTGSNRVLLVEDEDNVRVAVVRALSVTGASVVQASTLAIAREEIDRGPLDVCVLDYMLPDGDGFDLLPMLRERGIRVVFLTGCGTIELAVRAIKEGADQFLTKPVELEALRLVVERLGIAARSSRFASASRHASAAEAAAPFQGESTPVIELARQAGRVARSDLPVLIQGETGTGKGVLARWLHQTGARSQEPFVDLNCAGLSSELLANELLGHARGSFSGANRDKPGLFEIADRGTLFLDEIGDMSLENQAKVLKVIEERRFRRIGDVSERCVDVRIIAATNRDLEQLVADGAFRADLYHRIAVVALRMPPLRERGRDAVALARSFLDTASQRMGRKLSLLPEAEDAIATYRWPGNVRELKNSIERAAVLGEDALSARDVVAATSIASPQSISGSRTLKDAIQRHITAVLAEENGDVARAAEVLGISRSALYERLQKLVPLERRSSSVSRRAYRNAGR